MNRKQEIEQEKQEEEIRLYREGKTIERDGIRGDFQLCYLYSGNHIDAYTQKSREVRVPYLSWEFYINGKLIHSGGKFNPFPLEEAVELAFSTARKILSHKKTDLRKL